MDATDLAILRALGITPFQHGARGPEALRPATLANKLGLAPALVKDRITRMEKQGVIQGYDVFPNLRLLGLGLTTYHFEVPQKDKDRIVKQLRHVEGITGIFDFVGGDLCIDVFWRTTAERDRRVTLITSITGRPATPFFDYAFPKTDLVLSPLDVRILLAMRGRARQGLDEVAGACKVSTKTIARRIDRMVAGHAFDMMPLTDPSRLSGVIPVNLSCRLDASVSGVVAVVERELGDHLFYSWVPPGQGATNGVDLFAFAERSSDVEMLRQRAAAIPGVMHVDAQLPCSAIFTTDWLTDLLRTRLSDLRDVPDENGQDEP